MKHWGTIKCIFTAEMLNKKCWKALKFRRERGPPLQASDLLEHLKL